MDPIVTIVLLLLVAILSAEEPAITPMEKDESREFKRKKNVKSH